MRARPITRRGIVAGFLIAGLVCLPFADLTLAGNDPWAALSRMGMGFLSPDFGAVERIMRAIAVTSRAAGLTAHIAEDQKTRPGRRIWTLVENEFASTGP